MANLNIVAATPDAKFGGTFDAYLALPPSGRGPGLVLIQEIFGVNQVMRDLADGYARQGYVVACPDIFWRQQPSIQITDQTDAEWAQAFALFKGFDFALGVSDLKQTLDTLRQHGACTGKVGTVGYCLGGNLAYQMACQSSADASVSYYGVGLDGLLDQANGLKNPLLMHVAENDAFVPPAAQAKIKGALAANGHVQLYVYPGQDHAFARVGGKHFDQASADAANARTADFFKTNLF
jgi:carboxymethylenebutenolidase